MNRIGMFRSSIIANFRFRCSFNSLLIYNQCKCLQDRRTFSIVFFQLVLNKALESISELSLDRILCLLTLVLRLGNSRLVHKPSPIIYLPLVRTFVSTSCSFKKFKVDLHSCTTRFPSPFQKLDPIASLECSYVYLYNTACVLCDFLHYSLEV